MITKWFKERRIKKLHEKRMEQMRKNPHNRIDSKEMTGVQKMDQGFNGSTYTINGIEGDF